MSIAEQKAYCKQIGNHLRYINGLMFEHGIIRDTSPIQSAASSCQQTLNTQQGTYNCFLEELEFVNVDPDKKFRKVRPNTVYTEIGFELSLSISLKGKVPNGDISDPLSELAVGFVLKGLNKDSNFLINSWHIDRHIGDEESYFPHPLYHIQYGGKAMTENETINYGNTLLIDSPRIPCPPVDLALAIDYVLANYYGKIWFDFREDLRYREAISFSQKSMWRPYYKSLSDILSNDRVENDFHHSVINPQIS